MKATKSLYPGFYKSAFLGRVSLYPCVTRSLAELEPFKQYELPSGAGTLACPVYDMCRSTPSRRLERNL